jgi:hypothetical protein
MPAAKKRKVTTTTSKTNPSSVGAITAFTKVSKSQVISKWPHEKAACSVATQLVKELDSDRKRKLLVVEEIKIDTSGDEASDILRTAISQSRRDVKPLPRRHSKEGQRLPQTPKKPILASSNASSADTPTKGTRALLDELALSSSSSRDSLSLSPLKSQDTITIDDKSSFQDSIIEHQPARPEERLPSELLDLINLHASFLTALSLHHAHNGAHSPADLRLLCPDVARAWGKRKVMLDDIQRIIGILNSVTKDESIGKDRPLGRLSLSDYGHGKICVEVKIAIGKREKVARPLDENRLNDAFASNLRRLWEEHQNIEGASTTTFAQDLPLETISICSSLAKISPLLAKGQRRLEDLRAGIILKKKAEEEKATSLQVTDENVRKPTLLERLKAKELRQSTLPTPPSKAELSRNAALHRLEEVVSVLSLLTTTTSVGQQRVSFTLPTVLGKLRDSFKTPMSKEEGETCVRLLASDIAPEWLRVVRMGKVDAIVVNRDNRPSDLDIKERVQRAT